MYKQTSSSFPAHVDLCPTMKRPFPFPIPFVWRCLQINIKRGPSFYSYLIFPKAMLLACGGGKSRQSLFNPPCLTSGPKVYLAVACRSSSPPSYLRRRWWLHSRRRTAGVPATSLLARRASRLEAQRQWLNAGCY